MNDILDITVRLSAARSIADLIPEMLPYDMANGGQYDKLNEVSNLTAAIVDLLDLARAALDLLEIQSKHGVKAL